MKHISKGVSVKRITPNDGQYFFGYYDLQPYNQSQKLHLTHKAPFRDRLQEKGDCAEVGFIELSTGKYEKLDRTFAWNFQQGAMLQWNPKFSENEVIYNSMVDNEHIGVVLDINTGKKKYLDRPVANVSKDGKYALSVNMSRLYNFRPGYGYAWPEDAFYYKNHPKDDGVFVINMETGKSELVLSLDEIWNFRGKEFYGKDEKMVINHITFNEDGSRFVALVRNFPPQGKKHVTALITANRDGSDMYLLSDYGIQSHYWWIDNENILFFNDGKELDACRGVVNTYVLKDKTQGGYLFAGGFFNRDNHMSLSPNQKYMITDTYPEQYHLKTLRLYDIEGDVCADLGYFYELENSSTDVRCDLHPRWNRTSSAITFDSTHEGFRGIYEIELSEKEIKKIFD